MVNVNAISKKKIIYPISKSFWDYLRHYGRESPIPVIYDELLDYKDSFPVYDKEQNDTLWRTLVYDPHMLHDLNRKLALIYSLLKTDGDTSVMDHLYIERVDYCSFGNTNPFRVRIVNHFNDNYDYFYVKKADASRIYGLELEHILSPNRINYLVNEETLIEEHIAGIPGDQFIQNYLTRESLNRVRIAKEFVKFSERCFSRLLGDMRSYNYVVDITPDFEEEQYRVRAIDFDQQSYEGRRTMYFPHFFNDNQAVVQLVTDLLNPATIRQYQYEERTLIARRVKIASSRIANLMYCMRGDACSTEAKIAQLREQLSEFHHSDRFENCQTMGEIVQTNIEVVLSKVRQQ